MKQKPAIIPHPATRIAPESPPRPAPAVGSPYAPVILLFFVELLVAFAIFAIPREMGSDLVRENGPVETATVVFYGAAVLMALLATMRGGGGVGALFSLALGLLALRELDFHYRFTTLGIDQIDFYTRPEVPLTEKAVVVAILIVVAAAMVTLIWRGRGIFGMARRGAPCAISALAGAALLPVSVVLDNAHYYIAVDLARASDSGIAFAVLVLEETVELLIPALFLVAATQWVWRKDR